MTHLLRRSWLRDLWRRWPITIVTVILAIPIIGLTYLEMLSSLEPGSTSYSSMQLPSIDPTHQTRHSLSPAVEEKHHRLSGFRRVPVSPNEVDYVAEDVTIRLFTSRTRAQPVRPAANEIEIGDDVTIRYLAATPASKAAR